MNARLAPVAAALALSQAASAPALAQGYATPAGIPIVAVEAGPGWQTRPVYAVRGIDASAKDGNASQPERAVPQYGNTSGGPAS